MSRTLTDKEKEDYNKLAQNAEQLSFSFDEIPARKDVSLITEKYTRSIDKSSRKLDEALDKANYPYIDKYFRELIKDSMLLFTKIKNLAIRNGANHSVNDELFHVIDAQMEVNGDIIKFTMDTHLPKRLKRYQTNDRDIMDKVYLSPLRSLAAAYHKTYTEKVVFCIFHIYKSEREMLDHDNYDVKPIIDGITPFFLADDSPKYLSYYTDYRLRDYEGTEIFLVPESQFISFLVANL